MLAVKSSALGLWHTSRMEQKTAKGVRARVRAELTDEIKAAARRHLATDGANLSLRAIAREMGMVSSALYRYFASRDDLLTALIIDAYNDMGAVAERADAGVAERADVRARWMAVARALRAWALSNPAEYALLYGTPVPGYAAPADTTPPASRPVWVLCTILSDAGPLDDRGLEIGAGLSAEIRRIIETGAPGVSEAVMVRGLIAWTQLFGALNFELFGRINNVIDERDEWFDLQMRTMLKFIGLG
jgi:AcrR family transcriptional regulator